MLTEQNIESELSYAFLHAVASRCGFVCECRNRHLDDSGVDATITEDGRRLSDDSILTSFALDVQLKATRQEFFQTAERHAYPLRVRDYNRLRVENLVVPRILVVLFLPADSREWLSVTEQELIAKKCAYWLSLRGAPATQNTTSQTVYLPRKNLLTPDHLMQLMRRLSLQEEIRYEE